MTGKIGNPNKYGVIKDENPFRYMERYKKYRNGDKSKSSAKSRHKHVYDGLALLTYKFDDEHYGILTDIRYCTVCGKLGKMGLIMFSEDKVAANEAELKEKLNRMPFFIAENYEYKYLSDLREATEAEKESIIKKYREIFKN